MFLRSCPETCRLLERQTHVLCRVLCFAAFEVCGKHPSLQILYKYRHAKKYKDSFNSTDVVIVKRCDTVIHQSDRSRWRQWCWKRPSSSQSLTTFWAQSRQWILTSPARAVPVTWKFHCLDSFAALSWYPSNDLTPENFEFFIMIQCPRKHCSIAMAGSMLWLPDMIYVVMETARSWWFVTQSFSLEAWWTVGPGLWRSWCRSHWAKYEGSFRDVARCSRRGFHASWCCASLWRKAVATFP